MIKGPSRGLRDHYVIPLGSNFETCIGGKETCTSDLGAHCPFSTIFSDFKVHFFFSKMNSFIGNR